MADSENLTLLQMQLLFEVNCSDMPTISSLSKLMGENHGNCSSLCKKIETAGCVVRSRSKCDERVVMLQLTPLGAKTVETTRNKMNEHFRPVLQHFPAEKLETIRQGMSAMRELLQQSTLALKEG